MKRFVKKHINRFLPASVRGSIKRRLAAKFAEPSGAKFRIEQTTSGLRCSVRDRFSFLAPLPCQSDLAAFTDSAEGRAELYAIARAGETGGIFFDIGAHSGLVSALFCAANSQNKVFSFEPSPVLIERLVAIRELNQFGSRMCIEQKGIGQKTEVKEMALDPVGGFVQTQRFDHSMWAPPTPIQIEIESIPDAARRLGVVPQFIKIDIEGYEFEAITGAIGFFARTKPTLFLELHLNYLEQRKLSPRTLVALLLGAGYSLYTSSGTALKPSKVYDSPLPIVRIVAR